MQTPGRGKQRPMCSNVGPWAVLIVMIVYVDKLCQYKNTVIRIYGVFAGVMAMPFTCKYTVYAKTPYICMFTTNGSTVTGR